jgi:cytochrome c-type biogenesis protein
MKKLTLLVITALLTIVLLTAGCTEDDNGDEEEEEELETAPTFTLESTDNETVRLTSYQGKVVVLDFMFINCPPCQREMGHLEDVYDNYPESQVVIISIDTQIDTETEEELRTYKAEEGYEWIFCMDTKSVGESKYDTSSYPTLFIINQEGKIAFENVGETEYSTLAAEIDKLL